MKDNRTNVIMLSIIGIVSIVLTCLLITAYVKARTSIIPDVSDDYNVCHDIVGSGPSLIDYRKQPITLVAKSEKGIIVKDALGCTFSFLSHKYGYARIIANSDMEVGSVVQNASILNDEKSEDFLYGEQ